MLNFLNNKVKVCTRNHCKPKRVKGIKFCLPAQKPFPPFVQMFYFKNQNNEERSQGLKANSCRHLFQTEDGVRARTLTQYKINNDSFAL